MRIHKYILILSNTANENALGDRYAPSKSKLGISNPTFQDIWSAMGATVNGEIEQYHQVPGGNGRTLSCLCMGPGGSGPGSKMRGLRRIIFWWRWYALIFSWERTLLVQIDCADCMFRLTLYIVYVFLDVWMRRLAKNSIWRSQLGTSAVPP